MTFDKIFFFSWESLSTLLYTSFLIFSSEKVSIFLYPFLGVYFEQLPSQVASGEMFLLWFLSASYYVLALFFMSSFCLVYDRLF